MTSITQVESILQEKLTVRARQLARETGAVQREREFTGATLAQTFIFGWQQHPQASLEQMASTAQIAAVTVTDSAVHKRFTAACAEFLRRRFGGNDGRRRRSSRARAPGLAVALSRGDSRR